MKKFLVLLGMPRCATSWLNTQILNQSGVASIPRKEIHYFVRQYGESNRLSDRNRMAQFQEWFSKRNIDREKGKNTGASPVRAGRVEMGELAAMNPDPDGLWAKGGRHRRNYVQIKRGVNWYLKYVNGPVNDDWYRGLHSAAKDEDWCVDFSASNGLVNDAGFAAMAGFAETTKAILILRHPLDRLWSHVRLVAEKSGQVAEAGPVTKWKKAKVKQFVEDRHLLDRSLYGPVVKGTLTHFAPENRMIVNYEDIAVNPRGIVEEISQFLGTKAKPKALAKLEPREGAVKGARTEHPALAQFAAPCLTQLREVSALGVDIVDPWIADLEKIV